MLDLFNGQFSPTSPIQLLNQNNNMVK